MAVWEAVGASGFLALVTGWAFFRRKAQPYLAVGWLWFLGMLGAGHRSGPRLECSPMADRLRLCGECRPDDHGNMDADEWAPRLWAKGRLCLGVMGFWHRRQCG